MLKRQRPSSPPVPLSSFSDIPLITDSPGDLIERISKRRRTAPPPLDGTVRGWAKPQQIDDDDDQEQDDDDVQNEATDADYTQPSPSEYKSTNTLLRNLHTENQHRLLFSVATASNSSNIMMNSATPPLHHASHLRHSTPDKAQISWHQDHLDQTQAASPGERTSQVDDILMEEATRVAERYEGLNKMLGSYVLSRRRKMHSSDEKSGT